MSGSEAKHWVTSAELMMPSTALSPSPYFKELTDVGAYMATFHTETQSQSIQYFQDLLYTSCESWTLTAELQRRIQAMEMRCYHKILRISYKDHVTNEEVRAKIKQALGSHEDLPTIVKRRKLQWYGHVSFIRSGQNHLARHSERGKKTRQTEEEVGRQHQGMDRLGVRQVSESSGEQGKMEKTVCKLICGAPMTLAVN